MPAPVVHFEIGCKDSPKTQAFYSKVFGWEYQQFGPSAMIDAPKPPAVGIGGHISALGHPPHQYVTFYVQVENIGASLELIATLGGKTIIPPQEIPGMGHFAWFSDPEGNILGLWKPM